MTNTLLHPEPGTAAHAQFTQRQIDAAQVASPEAAATILPIDSTPNHEQEKLWRDVVGANTVAMPEITVTPGDVSLAKHYRRREFDALVRGPQSEDLVASSTEVAHARHGHEHHRIRERLGKIGAPVMRAVRAIRADLQHRREHPATFASDDPYDKTMIDPRMVRPADLSANPDYEHVRVAQESAASFHDLLDQVEPAPERMPAPSPFEGIDKSAPLQFSDFASIVDGLQPDQHQVIPADLIIRLTPNALMVARQLNHREGVSDEWLNDVMKQHIEHGNDTIPGADALKIVQLLQRHAADSSDITVVNAIYLLGREVPKPTIPKQIVLPDPTSHHTAA